MKGRGRRLVGLCLTVLLVSMCASESDDASHSLEPPRVIYVYDALGRLRAVTDPEADTAVYAYDAVGNITEIEHHPSDELSVVEVTPRDAAVGAEVVINGTGFDDASVFFGDAEAEVTEDSDVELVVTVPEGAEPGPVEVRAADGEASSDDEFVVDEDRAPGIDGFSPEVVAAGDSVTVEGTGFTGDRLLDTVVVDGTSYGAVESSTATDLAFSVPAIASSGRVSVSTPDGVAESADDLFVVPWGYAAADVESAARARLSRPEAVEIQTPGKIALFSFDGERGQDLSLKLSESDTSYCTMGFGLTAPGGIELRSPLVYDVDSCDGDLPELRDLPASGTYTLLVVPNDEAVSFDLTIGDRGADNDDQSAGEEGEEGEDASAGEDRPNQEASTTEPAQSAGGEASGDQAASEAVAAATPGGVTDGFPRYPVDLASGSFVFAETDLVVSDVSPVSVARSYQPVTGSTAFSDVRAFGLGSPMEFDIELELAPAAYQWAKLRMPGDVPILFERTTEGIEPDDAVLEHTSSSTAFYGARIVNNGHGWDLTLVDGTTLVFGSGFTAPLRAIRDRNGNQITVERARDDYREATGNVVSVHTASGRSIQFGYDDSDRVVEATDNVGRSASYSYDDEGRLSAVAYSSGGQFGYAYDGNNRIRTITGAGGTTLVTNEYDENGRVARQVLDDGSTFSFGYATDAEGVVTRTDVTDQAGLVRQVTFDAGFWLTDTYAVGTPQAQTLTAERDPDTHFIKALVDPQGQRTSYGYDESGNLTSLTELDDTPDAASMDWGYAPDFQEIDAATDPTGRSGEYHYDDAGNLVEEIDLIGGETTYRYDPTGRPIETTDAEGNTTTVDYELAHRVTVTDPDGHRSSEFHDAAGRLAVITDPDGNRTRLGYDDWDRVVSITDAQAGETIFAYDAAGNLSSVTDAAGNTTSYSYDALDRLLTRTDPSGAVDHYAYDAIGNLIEHIDRRDVRSTFSYDLFGRQTGAAFGVTDSGAESTVSYSYDTAGRLLEIDDSAYGLVSLGYDDAGRLVSETTPQGHVSYSYDVAGRRTATSIEGGPETTYEYDDTGALSTITQGDLVVSAGHDQLGRLSEAELPGGITTGYDYDSNGRLSTIDYSHHDEDLGRILYGYDSSGRRVTVAGDLAAGDIPDAAPEAHHDAANRLTGRADDELKYDAAGNLLSDGTNTYTWDARGQLTTIDGPVQAGFSYDPLGRRSAKTIDGTTTTYLYDGPNIAQERQGDAEPMTYLDGLVPDEVFARTDGDRTTTYIRDGLGSVIGLADADGSIATTYTYDPFGTTSASGDTDPNPYGYTGRELDETGLYYYRARYYQPEIGRFLSEDPLGFNAGDANLYAYVGGDPVNRVDPSGMCFGTALVSLGFSGVLNTQLLNVLEGIGDGTMSTEEAAIALDQVNLGIEANMDFLFTACGIEAMMTPSLGGVFGRGLGGFGRRFPGRASPPGAGGFIPPRDVVERELLDSMRGINPTGSGVNCVRCASAAQRRLEGETDAAARNWIGRRRGLERRWKARFEPVTGRAEIEQILRSAGDGSSGFVSVEGGRAGQLGHVFNVVYRDGHIVFYDTQPPGGPIIAPLEGQGYEWFEFLLIPGQG